MTAWRQELRMAWASPEPYGSSGLGSMIPRGLPARIAAAILFAAALSAHARFQRRGRISTMGAPVGPATGALVPALGDFFVLFKASIHGHSPPAVSPKDLAPGVSPPRPRLGAGGRHARRGYLARSQIGAREIALELAWQAARPSLTM